MAKSKGKSKPEKSEIRKKMDKAVLDSTVPEELLNRVRRDAARSRYLTPYLVSEKYEIKISTAKKLLKMLLEEGVVELYSGGHRSPIYISKSS